MKNNILEELINKCFGKGSAIYEVRRKENAVLVIGDSIIVDNWIKPKDNKLSQG